MLLHVDAGPQILYTQNQAKCTFKVDRMKSKDIGQTREKKV